MKTGSSRGAIRLFLSALTVGSALLGGVIFHAYAADCSPPPAGLVSWWRSEGNANDVTGNNSGTVVGATFVGGAVGEAFNFNGSGQKVTIPDNDALKLTNSLTIEGWIYPRANGFILFRGDSRPGLDPYALTIELTHELQFLICNDSGGAMFLRTPGAVPLNQWLHVAATLDGATGDARLYVNGSLAAQTNTTLRPFRDLDPNYGPGLAIGGHSGGYDYFSFDGMIDELSIYSRALTSNEIAAIYAADGAGKCTTPVVSDCVTPPAGLVSWWRGEGSGSDVVSGNNGSLSAGGASYATGLVGQGFRFDGTNGYLQIPDAPALKPANVTAEAWVWLDPALPSLHGGEQIVFKKNTWNAWFEGYSLLKITIDNGDGTYSDRFQFCVSRAGNQVAINSTTIAQRGVWYHVAATYDGNKSTLYVNGVAEVTAAPGFALDYGTDPVYIGTSGTWPPYLSMFGGIIDEPSIYGRALNSNEIAAIYHSGSAGKCSPAPPLPAPPVITDFSPKSGTNGVVVTLTGTNFSPVAASNIVYFGALRGQVVSASATTLTVALPVGATFAPPTVTVGGLTAFAKAPFMPTFNGGGATISSSSFSPRVDISNPMGAIRTVIADLDGDGKPDMAIAGGVGHGISLYRNISSAGTLTAGSFAPRVDIPTLAVADSPWDLVAADVDGDGRLDLLEANRGNNVVSILRNVSTPGSLGTNSFAPSVDLTAGDLPVGIAVRDVDGDGHADVVVANFNSGNIAVFRNTGNAGQLSAASFAAPVFFAAEAGTHWVSVDDLDGDGKPDLAAVNANANSVSILRNTSTPGTINASSFAPQFSMPAPEYTHCVKTADIDGDGKLDLLVASVHGFALSVFRNIASPGTLASSSFAARVDFPLGGRGHTISLGDLNGDGKLDVVVDTEIDSFVSVFQNQSTPGSFTAASLGTRVDLATGYNAWGASVGDLDGDGRPDIVFANTYDNTISLYRNVSGAPPVPGGVPAIVAVTPNSAPMGTPVTITGTNFSSIAASNIVYFGGGRALVTSASSTSLTVLVPKAATYAPITVTVGGLVASAPLPFQPTFAGGNSTLSAASFQPRVDLAGGDGAHRSVIADLDGDGKPDLAVANAYGHTVSLFRNVSSVGALVTNSFTARVDLPAPGGDSDNPYGFSTADVDGDGKLDLIACDRLGNNVSVYRNTATLGSLNVGSFAPYVNFPVGADPRYAAVADLDGDGRPDIVSCNFAANTISILRNIGSAGTLATNSFAPRVDLPAGVGAFNVAIGDLDGDGKPDLAVLNLDGFSMSVYRNISTPGTLAAGSFAPRVDFAAPDGSDTIAFGDLDGDGKPDLVIGSFKSYSISVYRNQATPGVFDASSLAARVDFTTGNWTHTLALSDLNGDGKPDIASVGELESYVSLFQNLSTPGNFTAASLGSRVDLGAGWNAWGLSAGDLDGDGCPDLVFCNAYDDTVSIYRNVVAAPPKITQEPPKETVVTTGSPVTFTVAATGSAPLAYQWFFKQVAISGGTNAAYSLPAATSTNAGAYQVRVTNLFGIAWSQGNLLTVLPAPKVPFIAEFSPKSGAPGSIVSLIGTNFSSVATSNIVYFGAERATVAFASATTLRVTVPVSATYAPPSVTVGGLTGAAKNSFTPTFAGSGLLTASNFAARVNLTPGTGPTATVMADFDGDGKPDLAVSDGTSHTVSVFRNISTGGTLTAGSFGPRVVLPGTGTSGNAPYMLIAADVNGDGKLDLVTTDMDANSVSVFRNLATPGVLTASSFAARVVFTVGSSPRDVVVRDLDGDGKPEIVTANGGSASVSVLKNVSSPSAITSTSFLARVDFAVGSGAHGLAVADLDGDGKPDIATANASATTISLLRNISALGVIATNSFAAQVTLAAPTYPHFLRAADIDGDGKLDLLLTTYLGPQSLSVYRSLATPGTLNAGSFASRVEFPLGTRGHTISIGDLNGDAKPDVVVDCEIPDRICVFQNLSTPGTFTSSSFATRVDLPAGYNAWGSSVGDLDGDARPDIAYANYYEGTISFAQNLSGAPRFLQQPLSQAVYVGDSVTLVASATGNQPLTYRWYRDSSLLNGAAGSSLTLSNAQLAQAGSYSASVSNAFGVVTSSNAVLTVLVPECATPPAGLVGWWSGNSNTFDSVSTNHGTWNGTAQYSPAKVDAGLYLDGANYLNVGNSPSLNVGLGDGMTIEGWINPASIADQQPLAEWASDGIEVGVHFWISVPFFRSPRPGCLYANLMDDSHNAHTFASASGLIQAGALQHVALTYDKTSGLARLYRNGQEVASANLGTFTPNTASDLLLGKRTSPPGINYTGVLDEMSLYNRSLSSNEIAALYDARGEGKCALAPTILAVTPSGAFVNEGQTVSFTALAVGSPVLNYQWQFAGVDISGAVGATLALSNVVYAQAGNYAVVVSNPGGTAASSNALLRINRAPVADAGATESLVISPNGSNAVVVLDGSRSGDPDGDVLTYAWFRAGDVVPFATGVVATPTLAVGSNALTLVVNDGMASGSQNLAVEVITTAEAVDRLITLVQTDAARANALVASLRAALAAIDRSQPATAINQLEAFINKVHAQLESSDPELAAQLIADAQAIIDALNGGSTVATAPVAITSIGHGRNGQPHLNIRGANGRTLIIETSTNLVDWEKVGVASRCGDCAYEFDDAQGASAGARFYRIVSPK